MYGVLYNTLGTRCKSIHSLIYLFKLKLNGIKTLKKKNTKIETNNFLQILFFILTF